MMTCHEIDRLVTPFIDGECSAEERACVVAHLRECPTCRERVDAEASAKQMLHAHATVARTRCGRASGDLVSARTAGRPIARDARALRRRRRRDCSVSGCGPATVMAVGVIGDSIAQHEHRFTARFNVERPRVHARLRQGRRRVRARHRYADLSDKQPATAGAGDVREPASARSGDTATAIGSSSASMRASCRPGL